MSMTDPRSDPAARRGGHRRLLSASQDIVIDAYRIECCCQERTGAAAAMGYRFGLLAASAGALRCDLRQLTLPIR
jgi:hypothetical protein